MCSVTPVTGESCTRVVPGIILRKDAAASGNARARWYGSRASHGHIVTLHGSWYRFHLSHVLTEENVKCGSELERGACFRKSRDSRIIFFNPPCW